ncbi:MAG: radical SAM family heme chaperone HemW, partial [Magnetococcales bacterium]|nr:radical SAM family heme chaperone HemW [Magnetococcales bacterium]
RKCPYCDFASEAHEVIPEQPYLEALLREMALWRHRYPHDERPLISIYLGGGTPSLMRPQSVARLLSVIGELWPLAADCEISMEVNPESATPERLAGYRQAGMNRISLGIQALDERRLKSLQRPHDLATARRVMGWVRQQGFERFGLDLIFATPGHTPELWHQELEEALAAQPDHLSCYALTLEPGTPFHRRMEAGDLQLPDEEMGLALFQQTRQVLTAAGYPPYEISNFAPPSGRCRHNVNYWAFGDYLGFGAGAHGKWSDGGGAVWRMDHSEGVRGYLKAVEQGKPWRAKRLSSQDAASECVMMGLRMQEGMHRATYAGYAGEDLTARWPEETARFVEMGLLALEDSHIRLTPEGVLLADGIMAEFLEGGA